MNLAAKVVTTYFDGKGIKYTVLGDEGDRVRVGFNAEHKESIEIIMFFDDDNGSVGLRSFDLCKFSDAKKDRMYKVCNKLNNEYRWVKYYVDERDNTITVSLDAVIQLDSAGEECRELVMRMTSIIDDTYEEIMTAIYGG